MDKLSSENRERREKRDRDNKRGKSSEAAQKRPAPVPIEVVDKVRVSKRQRQKNDRTPASSGAPSKADYEDDGFDVQVDGMDIGTEGAKAAAAGEAKKVVEQFYLSTERDHKEEAKERGLEMEEYQMDLMGDDASDIRKSKSVMRWDAKKKKYLPVMVSVDGKVVKGAARTKFDESGRRVHGDQEKDGLYKKWAKTTKRRIQGVGELEEGAPKPLNKWEKAKLAGEAQQKEAKTVEFDDNYEAHKEDDKKKKPIVPFHGQIDSQYLTNKQKRQMEKRSKKDRVVKGSSKDEIKTPTEIRKEAEKRQNNKLKQMPHLRKAKARESKEKRMQRREKTQMQTGARTKAKMLIIEGPRKGLWKGKKKTMKDRYI